VESDPRNIRTGSEIPTETYSDQPYVVVTDDGAWLCCVTTGAGREGEPGQHVVTMRSTDRGRTWSAPVAVEPAGGPEASYAVMLKAPAGGRVFIFYNHNTDDVREVMADDPPFGGGVCRRVDSLGHFVFRYSDDGGRTWSARRHEVPIRTTAIDRENPYGGELKFFWNVGRPFVLGGAAYVPLHKVGRLGEGFFVRSEGMLLRSADLLREADPARARWETLPEGDVGLRAPAGGGGVAEEQSFSLLSDGSIFAVYRTIDGHPACAYSRDGGRSWSAPEYLRYADGRAVKHPRAANFAWRCPNGKFLYWFHNHGGRFIREHPRRASIAYEDRNPAWLCGGVEADSPEGKVIRWSQPEIVLYDDDPHVRISYPDLIVDGGRYFLTETQKDVARVHEVDPALVEGLWGQFEAPRVTRDGLLLELPAGGPMPAEAPMPELPALLARDAARADYGTKDLRAGFAVDLWLRLGSLAAGQTVLDARDPAGRGLALLTAGGGAVELVLNDGQTECRWASDAGLLHQGREHHVVAIVDGGPKLVVFVVDGAVCDGGEQRQFGWGRFSPNLRHANGGPSLRVGPSLRGAVRRLRVHGRALRVSQAVGNFRAGPDA